MTTRDTPLNEPSGDQPPTPPEPEAVPPAVSDDGAGGMRAKLSEQAARITELEAQVADGEGENRAITMGQAFKDIELDPSSGMGKAVATLYDGEAEGLAEFAEAEFDYVYTPEHPFARQIADGHRRLDELNNTAGSVAAPTVDGELAKAESKGDYATTMAIKGQQVADMFRSR